MAQFKDIPNEILCRILECVRENHYSKQESLGQCALTCRSWRIPSQSLFFKTIRVQYKKELLKAKRVFKNQRKNDFSLGVFVRKLYYKSYYNRFLGYTSYERGLRNTFELIDKVFPNLEIFSYAPGFAPDKSFCLLYSVMLDGNFNSLKKVPAHLNENYKSSRQRDLYKKCVKMIEERNDNSGSSDN